MERQSILVDDEIIEERKVITKVDKVEKQLIDDVPYGYVPIELKSRGKLSLPRIIHVKDYNVDDALKLSISQGDNDSFLKALLGILEKNTYEKIDVLSLHEKELEEILITLTNNFWAKSLDKVYPLEMDEFNTFNEEQQKVILEDEETKTVTIPISKLNLDYIKEEFHEPIKIESKDKKLSIEMRLSRVGDTLRAADYVTDYFYNEEKKYEDVKDAIAYNNTLKKGQEKKDILPSKMKEYREFSQSKAALFLKVIQSLCIVSYNGKKIESLEEALKCNIPQSIWGNYTKFVEDNCNFGLVNEIEVKSPYTNKSIVRRFHFQFLEFLPDFNSQNDEGSIISFSS
jgi:hypothetical protein